MTPFDRFNHWVVEQGIELTNSQKEIAADLLLLARRHPAFFCSRATGKTFLFDLLERFLTA